MKIIRGQYRSDRKFKREDLINALVNYRSKPKLKKRKNPLYKNGFGEPYVRIRINGVKVKRSHIVWMLYNNKNHIPLGMDIHHEDERKRNDKIQNLKLVPHVWHGEMNLINFENSKIKMKGGKGKKEDGKL
jgi:hypothetical protein